MADTVQVGEEVGVRSEAESAFAEICLSEDLGGEDWGAGLVGKGEGFAGNDFFGGADEGGPLGWG